MIAAVLRELMGAGLEGEALIAAVERIEHAMEPKRTARQARNRRYYEKKQAEKQETGRLNKTVSDVSDVSDASDASSSPSSSPLTLPLITTPPVSSVSNETSESHPKRVRVAYSPDFDEFWKGYPRTPNMSKHEAHEVWKRLAPDDRLKATAAVPRYAAFLKSKPDHPAIHACRFLSKRRFEGFADQPDLATPAASTAFPIRKGTPEWDAWWQYHAGQRNGYGGSFGKSQMMRADDLMQPYMAPTHWPPSQQAAE